MKINIKEAIEFLDNPSEGSRKSTSSVINVICEDLNAMAFKHYLEFKENAKVKILSESVTQKTVKGKRLDRWIYVEKEKDKFLYQVEIKNWAANALGGKKLEINANINKIIDIGFSHWKEQRNKSFVGEVPNYITKVLIDKMKQPDEYQDLDIKPLVLYWMPICNDKSENLTPFFELSVKEFSNLKLQTSFKKIGIFSVSIYLRQLLTEGYKYLEYDMTNIEDRINILNKICEK